MKIAWLTAAVTAAGLLASAPAEAQSAFAFSTYDGAETLTLATMGGPVVLNTNAFQGWFSNCCGFTNYNTNTNYFTGTAPGGSGAMLNDFFAFDISGLAGVTVTGLTLSVSAYTINADLSYIVGDASALANAGELSDLSVSPDLAIYNALGAGGFGVFTLVPADSNTTLTFALNGAAVAAINGDIANADQYFAVGGTVIPSTVPEPSTWAMMLLGFLGLGTVGYRRTLVAV